MPSRSNHPAAGRLFLAVVGISTAAIGALFVWLLASSYSQARAMRSWPQVPCTILLSTMEERQHDRHSPVEYRHKILFGFTFHGQPLTSDLPTLRGSRWSTKREQAEQSMERLPLGASTTCFVSPTPPHAAVLTPDSLAPGYTIWFPMLFVCGGLVMAFRAGKPS